ncbi:MAG: hypothetical protein HRU71_12415 [Planctomycetia bacterium]|nr:MAG: hypothetical protein HRU71_12415 [Planctomycetia bacterium]
MKQRVLTWLLVLTFAAFATGAAAALHDHDAGFKAGCETCYLLVTVAAALIVAAAFYMFLPQSVRRAKAVALAAPISRIHRTPASPRAPPLD